MHRKHLQIILLATAITPVARRHRMTEEEVHKGLQELWPTLDAETSRRASALAIAPGHPVVA